MKKNDLSVSDEKPKLPEWYWHRGLHDAGEPFQLWGPPNSRNFTVLPEDYAKR